MGAPEMEDAAAGGEGVVLKTASNRFSIYTPLRLPDGENRTRFVEAPWQLR
jgi:hypothetical protein